MDNEVCPGIRQGIFYFQSHSQVFTFFQHFRLIHYFASTYSTYSTHHGCMKSNRLICFPIPGSRCFPALSLPLESLSKTVTVPAM